MWINRGNIENRASNSRWTPIRWTTPTSRGTSMPTSSFNRNRSAASDFGGIARQHLRLGVRGRGDLQRRTTSRCRPTSSSKDVLPDCSTASAPTNRDAGGHRQGLVPTYRGQQLQPGDIWYLDTDGSGNVDDMDRRSSAIPTRRSPTDSARRSAGRASRSR